MRNKAFVHGLIFSLLLMAFLAVPSNAYAGGVCGGTFTIEYAETLEKIAAMCGTTVSAIVAANPGMGTVLTVGQVIVVPGSGSTIPNTPVPTQPPSSTAVPPSGTYATYIVQSGDTFSNIAARFGVSVNTLWAANPSIQNINLLYVGQTIYIPGSSGGIVIQPVPTQELIARSWGVAPSGTARADVKLSNKSKAQAYISLQGTTKDGTDVIREYPVDGTFEVSIPAGWYIYVAWVGGKKMEGQFNLVGNANISITLYKDKVVVND
ncbi:MAG: LysM peptidoglycan-binding domain-containing protein [Anaerolineales bacterium]